MWHLCAFDVYLPGVCSMRRKDRAVTDRAEQSAILAKGKVLHMALINAGKPYIVPMNYGWDGECVYMHTANAGLKLDILDADNQVALNVLTHQEVSSVEEAHKACDLTAYYESITVFGRAEQVVDPAERLLAFTAILRQYSAEHLPLRDMSNVVLLRVKAEQITAKRNSASAEAGGDA